MKLLRALLSTRTVKTTLHKVGGRVESLHDARVASEISLEVREKNLNSLYKVFMAEYERTQEALKEAKTLNRSLEEALNAAREELTTCKEITIPGLIESHEVLIGRWKSESAVLRARSMQIQSSQE